MDTFIVRIYRRARGYGSEPVGTIEHVESGGRIGFASASELLDRLLAPRTRAGLRHRPATADRSKPREES